MTARRPRWELCRSTAGYWARFRSSNGALIGGNPQQHYARKSGALRSIGLFYPGSTAKVGKCGIRCNGDWLEVRDLTATETTR